MINIRLEILELFQKFVTDHADVAALRTGNDEKYNEFINEFPKETLEEKLTLENYCNKDDSFCYWLVDGLETAIGSHNRWRRAWLIYFDYETDQYVKAKILQELSDVEAMDELAKLHAFIANTDPKDNIMLLDDDKKISEILGINSKLALGNSRKLRITEAYYPDYFPAINSLDHITKYLKLLGANDSELSLIKDKPYQLANLFRQYYLYVKEKINGELSAYGFARALYSGTIGKIDVKDEEKNEDDMKQNITNPTNKIFYGPPGTGKTYKIQQIAKKYVEENFNEEAYLANIVKNISWLDVIIYAVLDIEKPCKLAEILKNRFYKAKLGSGKVNSAHIDQVLVTRAIRNPTNLDRNESTYPRRDPLIFDRNMNNEWFIVDSEKEQITEYIAEYTNIIQQINNPLSLNGTESQNRYEIVTFHQSFSYEDFVEGIHALTNEDKQIEYDVKPGIFKIICERAVQSPEKKFAIFIDEINRGNIANIFGELITLIEPDKRQGCENELSITLPYSKDLFSVPNNLDIYGTMNTSDHSLTKLDLALRRRFEFEELLPQFDLLKDDKKLDIKVYGVSVKTMLETMNERIEILLGRDYLIGHSYFLPLKDSDNKENMLSDIFKNKIIPLLQEYFFEDWERIQWVLNDQNKEQAYQFIHLLSETRKNDLSRLFGNVQNMNQVPDRRYQINEDAFKQAEAYSQILVE